MEKYMPPIPKTSKIPQHKAITVLRLFLVHGTQWAVISEKSEVESTAIQYWYQKNKAAWDDCYTNYHNSLSNTFSMEYHEERMREMHKLTSVELNEISSSAHSAIKYVYETLEKGTVQKVDQFGKVHEVKLSPNDINKLMQTVEKSHKVLNEVTGKRAMQEVAIHDRKREIDVKYNPPHKNRVSEEEKQRNVTPRPEVT